MMGAPRRSARVLVLLASIVLVPSPARGGAPTTLRVLFSEDAFTTVNRNDTLASAKAWIETVGRSRKIDLIVEVNSYASLEELRKSVRDRSADLYVVNSTHYLDLGADQSRLEPQFLPQGGGAPHREYLLLMRGDRRVPLAGLRGKNIIFLATGGVNLGRMWFDRTLREAGLGSLDDFCPAARSAPKPSSAILPVFFNQADACVADAEGFRVMEELNPQLGRELEATLISPPLLETLICVHREFTDQREELLAGLAGLHEEPAGRQILLVFKIDRLVPFNEQALDTVRELRAADCRVLEVTSR